MVMYYTQLVCPTAPDHQPFNLQLPSSLIGVELNQFQGSRLTFQHSSLVASERFDFTSQNKFSLATLSFCIISYCVQ